MKALSLVAGTASAFFVFYTGRLLYVTGFLRHVRPEGRGAYVGAVAFPALAVAFGWAAWRCWRRSAQPPPTS